MIMKEDKKDKKVSGNVNVFCGADLWQALDELHEEFGINKADILNNFIHHFFKEKDDLTKVIAPIIEVRLQNKLNEVRKLQGKGDLKNVNKVSVISSQVSDKPIKTFTKPSEGINHQGNHTGSVKHPINLGRTIYNFAFTDENIRMLAGEKDTWVHDIISKGLAIRFKKVGKVYYTRAKNAKIGKNTIRVKIGDTTDMTLQDARRIHANNLEYIYSENKNPNKLFPDIQHTRSKKHAVEYESVPVVEKKEDKPLEDVRDWSKFSSYTIDDLDTLGRILCDETGLVQNSLTNFKNKTSQNLHEQCLDMFRDGITIFELRKKCYKLNQYRMSEYSENSIPTPITYEMCIYRLSKAIFNFGTQTEKQAFNF